jgi:hypothetical protein
MNDNFAVRLAKIPPDLLELARGGCWPNAPLEEVVAHAEMMIRARDGKPHPKNEDKVEWWPGLSYRETRVIRDALAGHETVVEEDVATLRKLRGWFEGTLNG